MPTPSEKAAPLNWQATPGQQPQSVFGNFDPSRTNQSPAPQDAAATATTTVAGALTVQEQIDAAIARAFICRLLAKAFEEPESTGWKWLCDPQTAVSLRGATQTLGSSALANSADQFVNELQGATFESFQSEYVHAFGHTARGECPFNEVEYGDIKADPLFQPHRLADLGAFYSAFGLEITEDAAERHDHISVELEFMSVLAAKEAYAVEHQLEEEQLALCRDAQKTFLREHPARWIPGFTRRLERLAGHGPLAAVAVLTREFLMTELERFGIPPGSDDLVLRPVDDSSERLCDACGINNLPPGAGSPA